MAEGLASLAPDLTSCTGAACVLDLLRESPFCILLWESIMASNCFDRRSNRGNEEAFLVLRKFI